MTPEQAKLCAEQAMNWPSAFLGAAIALAVAWMVVTAMKEVTF